MTGEQTQGAAIARLEVQVEHLTEAVSELKGANERLSLKLDEIQQTLATARGGWRVMMLIGGAFSAVGGAIVWVATHVQWRV